METFAYHGVPLMRVNNDRVNGWQRLHTLFQPAPDGSPVAACVARLPLPPADHPSRRAG